MYKLILLAALCAWFLMAAHEWSGSQPIAQNDAPVVAAPSSPQN